MIYNARVGVLHGQRWSISGPRSVWCASGAGRRRAGRAAGGAFSPPAPRYCRVFHEGRAGPLARISREIARRSSQSGWAVALRRRLRRARYDREPALAATSDSLYGRAAKIVSSWPGAVPGDCTSVSGAMLRPLLLLALAALAPGAARRHAPDLREDEPARRTTRPAGESTLHPHIHYMYIPCHLHHRKIVSIGTCVYVNNCIPMFPHRSTISSIKTHVRISRRAATTR